MLELKGIRYHVEENGGLVEILRGIDLDIEAHRFVVITGPNGGGKSTLAKAIMGLVNTTEGQMLWNGADISAKTISERAKLGISYGFQQPPRFKGMKVRDLLSIASGNRNLSKKMACVYLTQVGLCADDYLDRDIDASLSGGEIKRIEIASILARGADLMIFDEPEAGIDLWSFSKLTETFRDIHAAKKSTVLVISHQERIMSLADEIIVISGGKVQHRGTKEEIMPYILGDNYATCEGDAAACNCILKKI